jgi:hypothetical protein
MGRDGCGEASMNEAAPADSVAVEPLATHHPDDVRAIRPVDVDMVCRASVAAVAL